jgi:hypothetical protein
LSSGTPVLILTVDEQECETGQRQGARACADAGHGDGPKITTGVGRENTEHDDGDQATAYDETLTRRSKQIHIAILAATDAAIAKARPVG